MIEKIPIAVDFDGVLHQYITKFDFYNLDPPNPGAIEWLTCLLEDGRFDIYIHSCRCHKPEGKAAMYSWLIDHGLPRKYADEIVFAKRKPHADVYIDDRGWRFNGVWPSMAELINFKPWHKQEAQPVTMATATYDDDATEDEMAHIQQTEHICLRCFHKPVCSGAKFAGNSTTFLVISRCAQFMETVLPDM